MDIRYSANQRDVKTYTTAELRKEFLIERLFLPDEITAVYSHVDRVITLGAMRATSRLNLEKNIDCWKTLGSKYFLIWAMAGENKVFDDMDGFPTNTLR